MKQIVLFGTGTVAEVVYHFMREDSRYEVAAFAIDDDYKRGDTFQGLPLVAFSAVAAQYPPGQYAMFIAVGYTDMNKLRAERLAQARAMGYEIVSYIHPASGIPSDCQYGENCFIMNGVFIHPFVALGDNVFVWSGALIGHHTRVGNHSWIASGANIAGRVTIGESCLFAVNATVGNRVSIGEDCFLGANTLLTKNLEAGKVLVAASTKPFRLSSRQFFKFSPFANL